MASVGCPGGGGGLGREGAERRGVPTVSGPGGVVLWDGGEGAGNKAGGWERFAPPWAVEKYLNCADTHLNGVRARASPRASIALRTVAGVQLAAGAVPLHQVRSARADLRSVERSAVTFAGTCAAEVLRRRR